MRWLTDMIRSWLRPRPGAKAERVAAGHLRKEGYRILARNLSNAQGEIDLVAQAPDGRTIVIVEVKSRLPGTKESGPLPEVRVNVHKQRQLAALAMQMVRRYRLQDRPIRFDVIGVDLKEKGKPVVRHHVGAFESPW